MAGTIDRFEACGDLYYRATGYLRPGKAEPLATGRESNSDENRERFEQWLVMHGWAAAMDRIVELETKVRCLDDATETAGQAWSNGAEHAIETLSHEGDGTVPSQIEAIYAANPHRKAV